MNRVSKLSVLFVLLFILSIFATPAAAGAKRSGKLGIKLGGFFFNFNRLRSIALYGMEPNEDQIERTKESLDSVFSLLIDSGAPDYVLSRSEALQGKVEYFKKLKEEEGGPLKTFYFREEDSSAIEGGKIESFSPKSSEGEYSYLDVSSSERVILNFSSPEGGPKGNFSLEFWVKPGEKKADGLLSSGNWKIYLENSKLKLSVDSGIESISVGTGSTLPVGVWSHLALIKDEGEASLYLNGRQAETEKLAIEPAIGERLQFGPGFSGSVDDLRIYGRAVPASRIGFTKPPGHILTEPVIDWVDSTFKDSSRWHFYAGLVISGLFRKSDMGELKAEDLKRAAEFLKGEKEGLPGSPDKLPERIKRAVEKIESLAGSEKLEEKGRKEAKELISDLKDYLTER